VARSVDNGEVILVSIKALVREIDGETALLLLFQVVHHICEFETGLAKFLGLVPELPHLLFIDVTGVVHKTSD